MQEFDGSELDRLTVELKDRAEKLGLYLEDCMLATPDEHVAGRVVENDEQIKDAITDGVPFMILAKFVVGDQAFSTRVQNPEQYEVNKEARVILPDPAEEIRRKLEEGKGLFDDD